MRNTGKIVKGVAILLPCKCASQDILGTTHQRNTKRFNNSGFLIEGKITHNFTIL